MNASAILLLFTSQLSFFFISTAAADTLTTSQSVAGGDTIVSSAGSFELGFFSPGASKNRYLGIWYRNITSKTIVWVANRDVPPLTSSSGVLKLGNNGVLVLLNSTNGTIWSSNSTRLANHQPVAQLLDSGNFVVRDGPESLLWQSFNYPCDTFLPGMKFGLNIAAGLDWSLVSWKGPEDPGRGEFAYRFDPRGYPQVILWKGSTILYRSGSWNGLYITGRPTMDTSCKPYYVINENEIYYAYSLHNCTKRAVVNYNGNQQRYTWSERTKVWQMYSSVEVDDCDKYGFCGTYGSCNTDKFSACKCLAGFVPRFPNDWVALDWTTGCIRSTPLTCQSDEGFLKYTGLKLPDTRESYYNRSMNLEECEVMCRKNCSCTAYTSLDIRDGGSGSLLWFGDLIDIREFTERGQDLYIRLAASELAQLQNMKANDNSQWKKRVIILLISLLLAMLLPGLALILYFSKIKRNRDGKKGSNLQTGPTNESQEEDLELPFFNFDTLANATNNFSINNKVGEGGFGPVYKGVLDDGQEIAVKRLLTNSKQGLLEFKNEVKHIAQVQHRNLVQLLGCCIQEDEMMLIYEFMPNKSLNFLVFDETQSARLNWPMRFNIINGIAQGLLYLHKYSRIRVIHRDLKASNVLPDNAMNPKISDFGMARSFGGNETEGNTRRVVGTYGYMPPEYAIDGLYSVKSDVYSFGVLVLGVVSGRRNRGFNHPKHNFNLLGHAWRLYMENRSMELTDATVRNYCKLHEVLRSIHVGLLCVQRSLEDRPSMSAVVLMLSG